MGCVSAKPRSMKEMLIETCGEKTSQSSLQFPLSLNEFDIDANKINKISELEKSCVAIKIRLSQDYDALLLHHKSINLSENKQANNIEKRSEVLKLMINLADEIQERSYTLFEKELNEEPKLEEYLVSLLWACKKLKLSYIAEFLDRVVPFFPDTQIDFQKVSPSFKRKVNSLS